MPESSDLADRDRRRPQLWPDFLAICDCGGRLAGTESERRAFALVESRAEAATGVRGPVDPRRLWRMDGKEGVAAAAGRRDSGPCHPLVRSIATPPGGLTAEVVDLGRGTPEEIEAHAGDIRGRIALVRHELMFVGRHHPPPPQIPGGAGGGSGGLPDRRAAAGHTRRRLIGPAGRRRHSGGRHHARGRSARCGARRAAGRPATLTIETEERPAETRTLLFDLPGQSDEWVVLSAHVDGHDGGESAMDNASGLAAVLAAARALARR